MMEVTVAQALQQAIDFHRSGRLRDAERLYRAILQAQPKLPDANHNLGVLIASTNQPETALPWLKQALETKPEQRQFWISYIQALIKASQLENARSVLEQGRKYGLTGEAVDRLHDQLSSQPGPCVSTDPSRDAAIARDHVIKKTTRRRSGKQTKALSRLGIAVPAQADIDALLDAYNKQLWVQAERDAMAMIANYPQHEFGRKVLGAILAQVGKVDEALVHLRKSVELAPMDAEAHSNLGLTFKSLGRFAEAEASYLKAIALKPDYAEAHSNLGVTLSCLGRLQEAEAVYRQAIVLKPAYAEAHNNLGNALRDLGRLQQAVASYRKAITLKPGYSEAHSNLGNALQDLGRLAEAQECYKKAIELKPGYAEAHNNMGNILKSLGRLTESEASYRQALALQPGYAEVCNNLGNALKDMGRLREAEVCYRQAVAFKPDLPKVHSNLLFMLNYVENLSPGACLDEALRYGASVSRLATHKFSSWDHGKKSGKMRIGFVSGDFRNHPVGYFLEGLLSKLDLSKFELAAYVTSPQEDSLTERIRRKFTLWRALYGMTDAAAARMIHEDGVHILIDLAGHTEHNRLPVFAFKPAPIQVSWLGYFATTGVQEIDYVLGDPHVTPVEEEHHFSERIRRLPETYLCFTPPALDMEVGALPALSNGYVTFGCFNNLTKMNDGVVSLWSRVLHAVDGSKLFLKTKQLEDPHVASRTKERFQAFGISADRLLLEGHTSRTDYFKSYDRVDLALDPFPYPGGTTSVEGLWMGVPVLAKRGNCFIAHNGETIAHNSGQTEWIAQDESDYLAKAIHFASNLEALGRLRARLRKQVLASPLFDAALFATRFGEAMNDMWEDYRGSKS